MAEQVTRLYYDGKLMNTITTGSTFRSMRRAKTATPEDREAIAEKLKQDWIRNADHDPLKFRIEHGEGDPMVLSNMTVETIRKSRENIGVH